MQKKPLKRFRSSARRNSAGAAIRPFASTLLVCDPRKDASDARNIPSHSSCPARLPSSMKTKRLPRLGPSSASTPSLGINRNNLGYHGIYRPSTGNSGRYPLFSDFLLDRKWIGRGRKPCAAHKKTGETVKNSLITIICRRPSRRGERAWAVRPEAVGQMCKSAKRRVQGAARRWAISSRAAVSRRS